jgi:hypothetical protein
MKCFQLIRSVLDEAYAEIPGSDDDKDAAIKKEMARLTKDYAKLLEKGCIDYSDPARRFAYLFTYTTSHANIVYQLIASSKVLKGVFDKTDLTISCVGGGPGSDFLGVLKYCELMKKKPHLTCHLLDRDPAWGESWSDVGKKVASDLQLTTHFNPFDVTDQKNWSVFKKHFQADLFTLIYFMSEVYALRGKADAYFDELFRRMKTGSLLLFVDNNSPEFRDWFDGHIKKHKLKVLESNSGVIKMPWSGPGPEEKSDLEPYMTRLGRKPKLDANVAWRVVQR